MSNDDLGNDDLGGYFDGWSMTSKVGAGVGATVVLAVALKWGYDALWASPSGGSEEGRKQVQDNSSALNDLLDLDGDSDADLEVDNLLNVSTSSSSSSSTAVSRRSVAGVADANDAEALFRSGLVAFEDACRHWETALALCNSRDDQVNANRARLYLGRAYSILALDMNSEQYGESVLNSTTLVDASRLVDGNGASSSSNGGAGLVELALPGADENTSAEPAVEEDPKDVFDERLKEVDEMYDTPDEFSRRQLLDAVKRLNKEFKGEAEVQWRLARALYEVAQDPSEGNSTNTQKQLLTKAIELMDSSLAGSGSENFACHKWYGILLGALGGLQDTSEKIKNSFKIRDHWQRATALNPQDATSRHLLGVWCYNIAEITWLERNAASLLFGTPPSSSYEEALEHFLQAEEVEPGFYKKNLLMIGKCYINTSNKRKARTYLQKALEVPTKTAEDRDDHKEAQKLLSSL